MFQEFFARSDLLAWPVVGLIIFLSLFCGVVAFVWLGLRDGKKIDEVSALPLERDDVNEDRSEGGRCGDD